MKYLISFKTVEQVDENGHGEVIAQLYQGSLAVQRDFQHKVKRK